MAKLELLVNVNTRGARELTGIGDQLSGIGRNLTLGVSIPVIAAGGALTAMAADAERADAKVSAAFESMGASSFTSLDALEQQADAMAQLTTFDDDAIKEAQATLLTFGNVGEESFERATAAALDMSSFFGSDLQSASVQLGKALNDPIAGLAALNRIGVQFTEDQKAVIQSMVDAGDVAGAQGIILAEVERQIGTAAEAMAATSSGQMQQAMNELGEAGEAMGSFLLPVLTQLAQILRGLAGFFTSLPAPIQQLIVTFGALAAAVGPVLWVGGKLIGSFQAIGAAFSALKVLLLANPYVALIAATAAIVTLIITNWDKITAMFRKALSFIKGVGEKLWTPVSEGFGAAIDFIRGIWNSFASWWNSIEISVPSVDIPFVGRIGGFTIGLPDLPMLAEGGIVTSPTLALLGEKGPEAVVPLDQRSEGFGTQINVTIQGDDQQTLEERIARTIDRVLWVNDLSDRVQVA